MRFRPAGWEGRSAAIRSRARPQLPCSTRSREPEFLASATRLGETLRDRLDELASRHAAIGEVRGLGLDACVRVRRPEPDRAQAVVAAAFERSLLLLACGLYGNVIRLLPPLTIADDELDEGLTILDEALAAGG